MAVPCMATRLVRGFMMRRLSGLTLLLCVLALPLGAKELVSDTGAYFDLPAGFSPGEGNGKSRFSYYDPNEVMELDILIYDSGTYATSASMASDLLAQMGSQGDTERFTYQDRSAVMAELDFAFGGIERKGYALFIAGTAKDNGYALVASAPASQYTAYFDLILSCLDSFSIDRAARRFPGPVSQFLLAWPPVRGEKKAVALSSRSASLPWSTEEAEHTLTVVQREYRILSLYLDSATLWQEAWARYYRMVYKESAARLDSLTEALAASLPPDDPTECARKALAWVQGFTYERNFAGIDFVPPLIAAYEGRGDCDSRAMVMAIVLEKLGIDSILMVSREYSHAMLGVDAPGGGQRFSFNGKKYLVAETTAHVGIGQMDAEQTDASLWLGIDVGE